MTPEQYERLTELFHAVMEVAPKDRAVFLKQISGGDADLQRELESMLAAHEQHAAQTQKSPDDIAAAIFMAHGEGSVASAASLVPNTRLAHYEIRSLLGKGGMGEVYLAEDLRLHRKVALKVLPAEVVSNRDKMRRFEQEARSAAALNHPNIAHIYEIGESESTHFIALEYIDGDTLGDKIHRDKAPLQKLLKYLIQVAEGLSKAHAAGIVHRDLKPDNIMITHDDDYAKILDFGLAKLIEPQRQLAVTSTATTALHSLAGMIMGTVGYMSPEQAQGRVNEIDHRSDIFSFGCILFEAVTGRRAFVSESFIESLHRVVHESPPPIKKFNPSAPPDLQRIVRRCLAKHRDERYQTIKDVAIELKEINLEIGEESGGLSFHYVASQIRRHRVGMTIVLATLLVAVSAFAYFSYFRRNIATALNEQYKILVMGIENRTGDAEFDSALGLALAVQLEQSPFLTILSYEQVIKTLRVMSRPLDAPFRTPEVMREICQRQGINVMLAGSIAPLDAHYVLTLEAIDARTYAVLARTQIEAESKERVLEALRNAANELRQKLGESLVSIRKFDAPLEQATTSSLEALKSFSMAMRQTWPDTARKISLYKRAIELDPNFALAYARLSDCYVSSEQRELALDAARKAFELRDRVSEWERLDISIRYYQFVTGEWDKVLDTAELWNNTYQGRSAQPFNLMSMNYRWSGQYEKAIQAANEAIRRPPVFAGQYENLGKALMSLNRFAEAREAFEQGLTQQLESKDIRWGLYALAFINRDSEVMQQQLDAAVRWQNVSVSWPAETAAFAGQRQRAHELALTDQTKPKQATAQYASLESLWDATFGRCQQSKAAAAQAFILPDYRASLSNLGLALALCGESVKLRKLIVDVKEHQPKATLVNDLYLPMIQAAGELRNNQPALAIQTLDSISKYEALAGFWPRYLRGQTYLKLHRAADAALEFQGILDHRGEDPLSFLYPLAYVGLARAAALAGDSHKSRKAYENFFALWKDADTDLPVLIEAKNEYNRVR